MKRPSGRHPLEFTDVAKSYGDLKVIQNFMASVTRGGEDRACMEAGNGSA